jgi:predicted RNase H-like HicB family nuclease
MKNMRNKISVTVEKTNTGFSAGADRYPVYTCGDTLDEIKENITDALNLYFDYNKKPAIFSSQVKLNLDLSSFFDYYKVINASALAKKIGMHPSLLGQYIMGKKRPSTQQRERILKGVKEIGKELAEIELV